MYKEIFQIKLLGEYRPNEGHLFLADLEKLGKNITILTQNVDGLHQEAGSTNVVELHGTLKTATCPKCKTVYGLDYIMQNVIPRCNRETVKGPCNFILSPDVVLYGDSIKEYKKAEVALKDADLLIVMGTSLKVSPVNTFPEYYSVHTKKGWDEKSSKMVLVNREPTEKDAIFPLVFHDDIISAVQYLKSEEF